MPRKLTVQQLDRVLKTEPSRGLDIIEKRAARRLASDDPVERMVGQLTAEIVDQARERMRP